MIKNKGQRHGNNLSVYIKADESVAIDVPVQQCFTFCESLCQISATSSIAMQVNKLLFFVCFY